MPFSCEDLRREVQVVRRLLDPHLLFLQLLHQTHFSASLLLDWLTSPETCFLAYLTRYLRLMAAHFDDFRHSTHTWQLAQSCTHLPGAASTPGVPNVANEPSLVVSSVASTPNAQGVPGVPSMSDVSCAPVVSSVPGVPTVPGVSNVISIPSMQGMSDVSVVSSGQDVPVVPGIPRVTSEACASGVPDIPAVSNAPAVPDVPGESGLPGMSSWLGMSPEFSGPLVKPQLLSRPCSSQFYPVLDANCQPGKSMDIATAGESVRCGDDDVRDSAVKPSIGLALLGAYSGSDSDEDDDSDHSNTDETDDDIEDCSDDVEGTLKSVNNILDTFKDGVSHEDMSVGGKTDILDTSKDGVSHEDMSVGGKTDVWCEHRDTGGDCDEDENEDREENDNSETEDGDIDDDNEDDYKDRVEDGDIDDDNEDDYEDRLEDGDIDDDNEDDYEDRVEDGDIDDDNEDDYEDRLEDGDDDNEDDYEDRLEEEDEVEEEEEVEKLEDSLNHISLPFHRHQPLSTQHVKAAGCFTGPKLGGDKGADMSTDQHAMGAGCFTGPKLGGDKGADISSDQHDWTAGEKVSLPFKPGTVCLEREITGTERGADTVERVMHLMTSVRQRLVRLDRGGLLVYSPAPLVSLIDRCLQCWALSPGGADSAGLSH